jgi:hypothetical protein
VATVTGHSRSSANSTPAATAPVTVLLREGTYRQSRPLVFTPEDSGTEAFPVTYAAYPGERPVVSGGCPFPAGSRTGISGGPDVPRQPRAPLGDSTSCSSTASGAPAPALPTGASSSAPTGPTAATGNRSFYFHEGDIRQWDRLQDAIVVVYHSWETSIHHIRSVDMESRSILLREPAPWPMGRWQRQQRYYVENVFEALDEPGEWY